MNHTDELPRLSRVEFFGSRGGELIPAVAQAIERWAEATPGGLSPAHRSILAWARLSIDVPNGGLDQFFYNQRGDDDVEELIHLLDRIEVPRAGNLLRDAIVIYRQNQPAFCVDNPWDGLFGSIKAFRKLERSIVNLVVHGDRALEAWIRSHVAELVVDEAGNPIDPRFTGTVEVCWPNGLLRESLEVKRGKPHGAYREYFDDGTIQMVSFYRSGEVTGDFWPDGRVKRKKSRRGPQTIIEWYHPSGVLQKRYVKAKNGDVLEPDRLYHENGQLAEEVHFAGREKRGPWLRFFDDGSPRLQAEYAVGETLIVHNQWADDRTQVVKDGSGVYDDDGCAVGVEYDVVMRFDWQHVRELKGGIPHGQQRTYRREVLWSVSSCDEGEPGDSTTYWDNGRVRSISRVVGGQRVESDECPRFDQPIPAVLLRVEANERLYNAWDHRRVDVYPQVLNLDEVQRTLPVPDFLREVHERNLNRNISCEYKNWDTFDDGIAYLLTVSETGDVRDATANGSGCYSGGSWNIYPPLLKRLRFTPGLVRGRAVECRVLARVDHTFVEGAGGAAGPSPDPSTS